MTHTTKAQDGFAHIMLLLAAVVLVGVGGVGYYVFTKQKSSSSSMSPIVSSAANKEVNDACNKQLSDKDFCKFASNWQVLENYKSTLVSTSKTGTTTMNMETDGADKTKAVTFQDGKEISAFITIGKTFYTKDEADGSWTKFTDDSITQPSTKIKDEVKITDFKESKAETDKTQYKKIGKEACDKLTCFKYQIIDPKTPTSEQFVWFDTRDYVMRRWLTKDIEGTTDMKLSYDKVAISAPSPIKSTTTSSSQAAELKKQIDDAMDSMNTTDTTVTN